MLKTVSLNSFSANETANNNTLKGIAFQVSTYWFALPIEAILKIIPCPPMDSPIKDCLGLVEWEKQTITVIDLSQKISAERETNNSLESKKSSNSFLILTQTQSAELCGFLTTQEPTLIEIPLVNIRSIPSSYRQVADLSIISKMAILEQTETSQKLNILLLGEWNK